MSVANARQAATAGPDEARPEHPCPGLAPLIDPVAPDAFFDEFWEKQPLVVSRDDRRYHEALFSLADLDHVLANSSLESTEVRVVRDGRATSLNALRSAGSNQSEGGLEALYQEYRSGATIVLQFLHERWAPLRRLCRSLTDELSAALQVNVYLTPPNAQGLRTHYDSHDVFVLQTAGAKRWCIYDSPIRLPLLDDPHDPDVEPSGEPLEVLLRAGDTLYLPRGYLHDAHSLDGLSLHLTVGVKGVSWASVLVDAVEQVVKTDATLRESIPPAFATDPATRRVCELTLAELLQGVVDRVDAGAVVERLLERTLLHVAPSLEGHLLDTEDERSLTTDTRLRCRPGTRWLLDGAGDRIVLRFHGKAVAFPAYVEPDLRFMAQTPGFSARQLPGELDMPSRILMIRRLVVEGFLTIVRDHPAVTGPAP